MKNGNVGFENILCDKTNICNLRCPFCYNDYGRINKTVFMDKETFRKVLTLIPLGRAFLFSCVYEPTLHPDFIGLLEMIPEDLRDRVFLTTNLTTRLSDETLEKLSKIKLNHINISLDSFDKSLYEKMRKGAKFERFMDNLERLVSYFSASASASPLRFISLVVKSNINEFPSLVEKCATKYLSSENEIRYISSEHHSISKEWIEENFPSPDDWEKLKTNLAHVKHKYTLTPPPAKVSHPFDENNLSVLANGDIFIFRPREWYKINDIEPYDFAKVIGERDDLKMQVSALKGRSLFPERREQMVFAGGCRAGPKVFLLLRQGRGGRLRPPD